MKSPPTFKPRALLYLCAWLPVYVFYVAGMRQTAAPSMLVAAFWTAAYLAPAVLTGALIWRVSSRVRWREISRVKFAALEIRNALWLILQWHVLFYGYMALVSGFDGASSLMHAALVWQLDMALLVAGIHAAVFHAVRAAAERRAKEVAAAEAEALRVRAEMVALRGQLDPHFLFNSLHSITALVRESPTRAEEALLQFAALLRRVLDVKRDSADEVLLEDELRFVDDYLAIERLRLDKRLRVERDIAPDALSCRLPAFSVQPLVENAIGHAIAPRRDGGTITLRAAVRAGRLEVTVADNGPGADPTAVNGAHGVGLRVIRQRLALRHGAAANITVDTKLGAGFRVTLSLPAENASEVGRVFDPPSPAASTSGAGQRPALPRA